MTNIVAPVLDKVPQLSIDKSEIRSAILNLEVMPSMRALMTAGEAAKRDEMALYNCSFVAMDHPRAFDEILYILTCGTGVGFSCETRYVNQLPDVAESFHETDSTIVVGDSRIGWASAYRELIAMLYAGKLPRFDVSKVRPKGARLKVFGGRASGPDPLVDLFNYTIRTFRGAAGRKLTDIEVHGLVCKRDAKAGMWWERNPEFALANNSAVYEDVPTIGQFLEEWTSLYNSKSGERGIYYRKGIRDKTERIGKRDADKIVGTNPLNASGLAV